MYFGTSYAKNGIVTTSSYAPKQAPQPRGPAASSSYTGRSYGAPPRPPAPSPSSTSSSLSSFSVFSTSSVSSPSPLLLSSSSSSSLSSSSSSPTTVPAPPADVTSTSYRPRGAPAVNVSSSSPRTQLPRPSPEAAPVGLGESVEKPKHMHLEVLEADMSTSPDDPLYKIKLNLNGRQYVASRHHNKLRGLVEQLRTRGYRILGPFPEVEDMVTLAPALGRECGSLDVLPFYEGFGYSIKSLASTVLRSSAAVSLRRHCQLEQISRRIDAFLKAVFVENDDLQFEQQIYHFFWEPLEKKLSPVLEELEDESAEEEHAIPLRSFAS